MPFMIGPSPIRRTTNYLKSGRIILKETVKIFTVNYNHEGDHHKGARDFVFWNLPQVQHKNPKVQCLTFRDLTPTPFIRIFFEDTKDLLVDIDSRDKEEIVEHLVNLTAVCLRPEEISSSEKKIDSTLFGYGCKRHCICEVLGQVPCPRIVTLPDHWRGKGRPHSFKMKFRLPPCYMVKGLEEAEEDK